MATVALADRWKKLLEELEMAVAVADRGKNGFQKLAMADGWSNLAQGRELGIHSHRGAFRGL